MIEGKYAAAIKSWKDVIQRNEESQKALADKGLFEQAARIHSDNMLIESFIKELVELQ